MPRECSKPWYRDFLCLPGIGFVPGKDSSHLYGKKECRDRLGPSNCIGQYPWVHRGGADWCAYVIELYERVYQKKLRRTDWIPWHFARGLLAEEDGEDVDWAQYAISKRRSGTRNKALKLMKKYRNLRRPLPFTYGKTRPTKLPGSPRLQRRDDGTLHGFRDSTSEGGEANVEPADLNSGIPLRQHGETSNGDQVGKKNNSEMVIAGLRKMKTIIVETSTKMKDTMCEELKRSNHLEEVAAFKLRHANKTVATLKMHLTWWEEKQVEAKDFQGRASRLLEAAIENEKANSNIKPELEGLQTFSDEVQLFHDALELLRVNANFAKERIQKLKDSIAIQEKMVSSREEKLTDTKETQLLKRRSLDSDIAEMAAVIAFMDKPEEVVIAC